jgi:DNA-binding SARP family transcriptional activator
VRELHVDAELALGRHAEVVAELTRLVTAHPLREGLHAQLMLALHRAGRRAEALSVYDRLRVHLAEELGLDPSSRLRQLQLATLRGDTVLDEPPETRPPSPAGNALWQKAWPD